MYTPSLLEHLRLKWDEETDKGLATEKMAGFSFQPAVLKKKGLCLYRFNKLCIVNTSLSLFKVALLSEELL